MNYKDKFVGIKLFGFCNGYFGRDSYDNKVIIASGKDWIVTTNKNDNPNFAYFDELNEMENLIKEWSIESQDED